MTYLTDDLLAAIRREHSCPECSGRFIEPAGDEAANLPDRAGGGATPPASFLEPDPLD